MGLSLLPPTLIISYLFFEPFYGISFLFSLWTPLGPLFIMIDCITFTESVASRLLAPAGDSFD